MHPRSTILTLLAAIATLLVTPLALACESTGEAAEAAAPSGRCAPV